MSDHSPRPEPQPTREERLIQELDRVCAGGDKSVILQFVDRLFCQKPLTPWLFKRAVAALREHATNFKEWTPKIAAAYASMSLSNRRASRGMMLWIYSSVRDHKKALEFVPKRFPRKAAPLDLAFALETLVGLGRMNEARKLLRRFLDCSVLLLEPDGVDLFLNSLAGKFAAKGDWKNAIMLWQQVTSDEVLGPHASVEIAAARIAQAREAIEQGLRHIDDLRHTAPADMEIPLTHSLKGRLEAAEIELLILKRGLEECIPSAPTDYR